MKTVLSLVFNNFVNDARVLKETISLHKTGEYKVKVVALHENELPEHEEIKGIPVHRIKLFTRNWSKSLPVQALKYLELAMKIIKKYKKVDIIHCNDLGPLPIAVAIKKLSRNNVKIIYDAHEYEPERNGLKGLRKYLNTKIEGFFIKHANEVITVSNSIANAYQEKYGIKKPSLVLNCPNYQEVTKRNNFREKFGISANQKIFLYQGALSKGRGLEIVLEAFRNINNNNAVLVVMGYGMLEGLVREFEKENNNIYFHEAVSPLNILDYTSSADIGICLIEDTCLSYRYALPNKYFEYAMSGLPILTSNLPEMMGLTVKYNSGWVVKEESSLSVEEKIKEILESETFGLAKNAKEMSRKFCWEEQERNLLTVYQRL